MLSADDDVFGRMEVAFSEPLANRLSEDWIATADTLEYELAPALLTWRAVLDVIAEKSMR